MTTAVYELEIRVALEAIQAITHGDPPRIPDDLPGYYGNPDDHPAAIAILTGKLTGTVEPDLKLLVEALDSIEAAKKGWGAEINRIADVDKHALASGDYAGHMTAQQVPDYIRTGRARQRTLNALRASIQTMLSDLKIKQAAAAAAAGPPIVVAAPVVPRHQAPLPPRRFNGAHKEYKQFMEIFEATVGNTTMEDVEKLARLLSLLDGEPKRLLSGLMVTGANYPEAKEILRRRYEDVEKTSRELRLELTSLPIAKSAVEVHELQINIETIVSQLKGLGVTPASAETIMMLESKLPRRYLEKLQSCRKKVEARTPPNHNVWDLDEFRASLEEIVKDEGKVNDVCGNVPSTIVVERDNKINKQNKNRKTRTVNAAAVNKFEKFSSRPRSMTLFPKPNNDISNNSGIQEGMRQAKVLARGGARAYQRGTNCLFCQRPHPPQFCTLSPREKRERVFAQRLCMKCMKSGHFFTQCRQESCRKCNGNHHTFLCPYTNASMRKFPQKLNPNARFDSKTKESQDKNPTKVTTVASTLVERKTLMMCVYGRVINLDTRQSKVVPIFVDSGSTESYITKKLAKEIGLTLGPITELTVSRFGDKTGSMTILAPSVKFGIESPEKKLLVIEGLIVKEIIGALAHIPKWDKSAYHSEEIRVPTKTNPPEVMLGVESLSDLRIQFQQELPSGFAVYNSTLGPLICGRGQLRKAVTATATCATSVRITQPSMEDELHRMVKAYFESESCKIINTKEELLEREDELALQQFNKTVKYVPRNNNNPEEPPGRYAVTLPWRNYAGKLPDNFGLTIGRLRSTLRRLRQNPSLMKEYDNTMREQIEQGILERVYHPRQIDGERVYYIPHQPVFKESSTTTKMRIVFDASSGKPSLNDLLYRGKVYAGKDDKAIPAIILRARLMPILISMDLARAFLQILVQEPDRDVARILWPSDPENEDQPLIYRFTRVTFGIGPSPFLLGATIEYHLKKSKSPWGPKILRGGYVDNYLVSVEQEQDIREAVEEIRELFWAGGFNCRQFLSNAREEIKKLPEEWQETKKVVKLLGIKWDTETDEFSFKLPVWPENNPLTKRTILAHIASLYDPCGWLSPAILRAKNEQAMIWHQNKAGWDEPIPPQETKGFLKAVKEWTDVEYQFPRRYLTVPTAEVTQFALHGFSDASQDGIGFAIYLRATDRSEQIETSLVFARALVVPTSLRPKKKQNGETKELSIPRLELHAMKMLVKAIKQIPVFLQTPIAEVQLWTDATTVVQKSITFH